MLKNRFFRVGSKGIVYNEKYYGTKASFNSYLEGFEKFELGDTSSSNQHEESFAISTKNIENDDKSGISISHDDEVVGRQKESSKPVVDLNGFTKVSRQALKTLTDLGKGNNLEKFLEAHGVEGISVPEFKKAFDKFLSKKEEVKPQEEISKWATQLENLRGLRDGKELEKWLESRGVPAANVSLPEVQKELQKYFKNSEPIGKKRILGPKIGQPTWGKRSGNEKSHEKSGEKSLSADSIENLVIQKMKQFSKSENNLDSKVEEISIIKADRVLRDFGPCMRLEDFKGRSLLLQEDTLANKLWEDFRSMSTTKQVAIVVGITVVTAALGFVSWRILLLAFPSAFRVNHYWTEVLAQWFIQRQESTFHLLQHTAQNSKPLSTAWANQYLLWKYI